MLFLAFSVGEVVYQIRQNLRKVREMAYYTCKITVERDGKLCEIDSLDLTPGDKAIIKEGLLLPCDGVLLQGSCLADEGMLTGETIPVNKEPLPFSNHNIYLQNSQHTLFTGTKIVFAEPDSRILVINTGFNTVKGKLVKSILFPRPNRFKFEKETMRFLGIMSVFAIVCCILNVIWFINIGEGLETIIVGSLDIVSICIPPALPLAMTLGINFAIQRLQDQNIACISPPAINAAGRVSVICFDKTGTLTEDSMRINGVWDANSSQFYEKLVDANERLQECIASCHNLAYVNGEVVGDFMELEAFKQVGWSIQKENALIKQDERIQIIHRYHFESTLKRMACVVLKNEQIYLYVKGAPEVILSQCLGDIEEGNAVSNMYAQQGFRLLACGVKQLDEFNPDIPLNQIEKDLEFLGLILFKNHIKAESYETITTLQAAGIKCLMSTGDSLLTAINIAKQCNIISPTDDLIIGEKTDQGIKLQNSQNQSTNIQNFSQNTCLAITGDIMQSIIKSEDNSQHLINKCKVFARMSPKDKQTLIEILQVDQQMVAMVGDGTNDCSALRTADVGLSLSKADASIAAPFTTSQLSNITKLLCEGRGTLMTCFQCFKYIATYSLIQNSACNILHGFKSSLTDQFFMFQDMAIVITLAFFITKTKPLSALYNDLPPANLISRPVLLSIAGHACINTVSLLIAYLLLLQQDWYKENSDLSIMDPNPWYDNTTIFIISSCQLIISALVFSVGQNFRQPLYRNIGLMVAGVVLLGIMCMFVMFPIDEVLDWFSAVELEEEFRPYVMMVVIVNGMICWIFEYFYIGNLMKSQQLVDQFERSQLFYFAHPNIFFNSREKL